MNSMVIALLILAATIALFIWEPIPIVVTAIGASILYAYTGIIEVNTIFSGYNSTTIVLLAAMMVVGASLFHTGVTDIIGEKMVKITGKSERNIILVTLIVSCLLSAVCSNIGVMVAMAPARDCNVHFRGDRTVQSASRTSVRCTVWRLCDTCRRRFQRIGSRCHAGTRI